MTFNELLLLIGAFAGLFAGASVGHRLAGLGGAVVGAVIGPLLGYLLGRFCNWSFFAFEKCRIRRKSSEELKDLISHEEWQWVDVVLLELKRRGIDIAKHADFLLNLMVSDQLHERLTGKRAFEACFPERIDWITGYSAFEEPPVCREKLSGALTRGRTNGLSQ